tara:strand:- start:25 stop:360 length:336 start_codon:yes stop_codon:yes gene_type:complete
MSNQKTLADWIAISKVKLEKLLTEPKEKQNELIQFWELKALRTHLLNPELKNIPKSCNWESLKANQTERFNNGKGFTKLQVLKIQTSDKFPKALATEFEEGYKAWEIKNLV